MTLTQTVSRVVGFRRRVGWCTGLVVPSVFAVLALACLDPPVGSAQPVTTDLFTARINQDRIERIDLLFMIDNSSSMSDKQRILQTAVPDLVDRLVNPICIDADGRQYPAVPPGQPCPDGQHRQFRPVSDIHVGVVSSSLGDVGAGVSCATGDTVDNGHLVGSLRRAAAVPSNEWGFITWRDGTDPVRFKADFQALVQAVGEKGCGFEASLEAWYRFLIDPVPYAVLEKAPCSPGSRALCTTPRLASDGTPLLDDTLLAQRAAFLRPDSLVAIVVLSDENDCSLRATGQAWLATTIGGNSSAMFAASSACADDPTSTCCYSCPAGPPAGCEWADEPCRATASHLENRLPPAADAANLRCFDQKRRFGVDFLYPTERYVNALSRYELCPSNPRLDPDSCPGATVPNPLYSGGRAKESVYLAGIVGVPWQDIAASSAVDGTALPADVLRFQTAAELRPDGWDRILGAPEAARAKPPADLLMQESTLPRPGVVVGGPNGREYATDAATPGTPEDLEYACIFPLEEPRSCADATDDACDCSKRRQNQPLCEARPGIDAPTTTQHWAKAYPGLRELEVLKGYGDNSIVASICARNVKDLSRPDFGYRPAITSIVDRLGEQLARRCLPRALDVGPDGSVPCTLVEVEPQAGDCSCDASHARIVPPVSVAQNVRRQLASSFDHPCRTGDPSCKRACLCELQQIVTEPALTSCRTDENPTSTDGWCYVADADGQHIGSPALVADCRPTERRLLRIAGDGLKSGAFTVISCAGRSLALD